MSTDPTSTTEEQRTLGTSLKPRHLTMMGLGSAIGAGLFLGSGVGIQAAGPAVLVSYTIAGILVMFVMHMLGEMAAAIPSSGSFATYAGKAFGPAASFSQGWLYYFMLAMVMGAEITGAGAFMGKWLGIPGWIPGLIAVTFFALVNLVAVKGFGEFEYWFSFIKVAVIGIFLIIGILLIAGLLPGHTAIGLSNFEDFAPNGFSGIITGLLAVAFAFGGIEIVTIAAAESAEPQKAIASAVKAIMWRIALIYLGSVFVITAVLPYSSIHASDTVDESPFTMVLALANIPGVAAIMEVVIVIALLSAFNAQIYATSRLLYSFAQQGNAPKLFRHVSPRSVPDYAVWCSLAIAFASVALQVWGPENMIQILFNIVGGSLLVVWLFIALSEIKLRPSLEKQGLLTVKMWGYPYLSWAVVVALIALTALMLTQPNTRSQVLSVAVFYAILSMFGFIHSKRHPQLQNH